MTNSEKEEFIRKNLKHHEAIDSFIEKIEATIPSLQKCNYKDVPLYLVEIYHPCRRGISLSH